MYQVQNCPVITQIGVKGIVKRGSINVVVILFDSDETTVHLNGHATMYNTFKVNELSTFST